MIELIVKKSDDSIVQVIKGGGAEEFAGQQHKVVEAPDQDIPRDEMGDPDVKLDDIDIPTDWTPPLTEEERLDRLEKATGTGKNSEKGISARIDDIEQRLSDLESQI